MGSKANQNLISCQTLAFPSFSPLFFLKNGFAHEMSSPKTIFGLLKSHLSVRPCLAFHPILTSHFPLFFALKSLIPYKALFGHPINPVFHF